MAFDLGFTSAGAVILENSELFGSLADILQVYKKDQKGMLTHTHPKSLRRFRWLCHPVAWNEHPKHLRLHGLCPRKPAKRCTTALPTGKTGGWLPLHIAAQKGHLVVDSVGCDGQGLDLGNLPVQLVLETADGIPGGLCNLCPLILKHPPIVVGNFWVYFARVP